MLRNLSPRNQQLPDLTDTDREELNYYIQPLNQNNNDDGEEFDHSANQNNNKFVDHVREDSQKFVKTNIRVNCVKENNQINTNNSYFNNSNN